MLKTEKQFFLFLKNWFPVNYCTVLIKPDLKYYLEMADIERYVINSTFLDTNVLRIRPKAEKKEKDLVTWNEVMDV